MFICVIREVVETLRIHNDEMHNLFNANFDGISGFC